jgi:diguanylate cyclase (GGDEF)-like protein
VTTWSWPTTGATLALPQTTERDLATRAPLLKSRIGRRVVGLFILSALVPLGLCAAFLFRQFGTELTRTQQQNLDSLVRSFGMTVLGRLGSADDVLQVIVSAPGMTDEAVQDNVAKLLWVRSVRRVQAAPSLQQAAPSVPIADARQQRALNAEQPALLWGLDPEGLAQVYLVRKLPSGARLYVEITAAWLWAGASEFASNAGLLVLDNHGELIASGGTVPAELLHSELFEWTTSQQPPVDPHTGKPPALLERFTVRSWEVFLGGRFSSPSWHLLAISPRVTLLAGNNDSKVYLLGFILLTILLISWLSMTTIRRQLHPLALLMQATKRVAQRDFEAFGNMSWNDEFGDLARSFSAMSSRLKIQFSALETLSEVDRILLHTPELEPILDSLLPRMAHVLHCDSVSLLLFDPDSEGHARAYDYHASEQQQPPVRRIAADIVALKAACEQPSMPPMDAVTAAQISYLAPITALGINAISLHALKFDRRCAGVLCIGYASKAPHEQDTGVAATDFADRLSLILANLQQTENLHRQANFDSLTGLQSRHLFSDRVCAAVAGAQERRGSGALLYIDLDQFKRVNDTAGHSAGDGLLRIVGERLTACVGEGHSIARLGGDEFAVLLPTITEPDSARQIAERIIAMLQQPIVLDGREHHVSASIGITVFPADGTKLEELFKTSDIAMYQAKEAGRGRAVFFQAEMQRQLLQRLALETGMHRALQRSDFRLFYQPIVSEAGSAGIGVEALVRWPGKDQAPWITPAEFVPIAEENGLIVKLGDWILRNACEQFARWRSEGLRLDYMSVNVSVRQLREGNFPAKVFAAVKDNDMLAEELQIEITESVLAHGLELQRTLLDIAAQGVRLALDDFGTGYSSLSYLRAYPIHTVKIDRSFIQSLPEDAAACRLAESIIVMCAALGKHVVAEGVETEAQLQFLRQAGCTSMQGYLLGRPMEAHDLPGMVRRLRSIAGRPTPAISTEPEPQSVTY